MSKLHAHDLPQAPELTKSHGGGEAQETYLLRLYIAGMTPLSKDSITNVKRICEEQLSGRYQLEVIDLHQQPQRAKEDEIIAVPTLIRKLPEPLHRIVGDLTDDERVVSALNLPKRR